MKEKICFVVQRYGLEVNGGAELLCRQLAEHMVPKYKEVHILTSKAIDYMTWKDEYTSELEEINGVIVHRFSVSRERRASDFNQINARFLSGQLKEEEEREWINKQGPEVPELLEYLSANKDNYDAFIFLTYLYYPTVLGVELVKDKAIVLPLAHDEPYLQMKIFDNVFLKPKCLFFETEEEKELVHGKYHNEDIPNNIGGAGVDIPETVDGERFKNKYGLSDFMVYVGRIDEGKNCHQLFQYFLEYKKRNANDMKLVLMGKPVIDIPKSDDIVSLGFVDEQDKFDGIAAAKMLILPSEFESLSIVVLEAMSVGTPVIVNGKCPVLKGHCIKSNGAFYYRNYFEFEGEVNYLREHTEVVEIMKKNAKKYVNENYQWEVIVQRLSQQIESIR